MCTTCVFAVTLEGRQRTPLFVGSISLIINQSTVAELESQCMGMHECVLVHMCVFAVTTRAAKKSIILRQHINQSSAAELENQQRWACIIASLHECVYIVHVWCHQKGGKEQLYSWATVQPKQPTVQLEKPGALCMNRDNDRSL